jgi:hypothetical protein
MADWAGSQHGSNTLETAAPMGGTEREKTRAAAAAAELGWHGKGDTWLTGRKPACNRTFGTAIPLGGIGREDRWQQQQQLGWQGREPHG